MVVLERLFTGKHTTTYCINGYICMYKLSIGQITLSDTLYNAYSVWSPELPLSSAFPVP